MKSLLRNVAMLGVSFALSYWLLLGASPEKEKQPEQPLQPYEIAVSPQVLPEAIAVTEPDPEVVEEAPEEEAQEDEASVEEPPVEEAPVEELPAVEELPVVEEPPVTEPEATPPPAESGSADGTDDGLAVEEAEKKEEAAEVTETEKLAPPKPTAAEEIRSLMESEEYREVAEAELDPDQRLGFTTALKCSPEDQLALARFFGERIVLVPKASLAQDAIDPVYYVLEPGPPPTIRTIHETPDLAQFRQYRDLFDFDYARLPPPVRELRRKVVNRSDIFLFAALIPVPEWALVVARRSQALQQYAGQNGGNSGEVDRYTLRYRPAGSGAFDLRVEEIAFADGKVHRPN